jgi:hypothetical protein
MENQTVKGAALAAPVSKDGIWRYGVRVRGIKKRCRNIKWHVEGSRKGLGDSKTFDPDLAQILAKRWIADNMKTWDQAFAMAYYWTFDPVTGMEGWEMFNDAHNKRIPLYKAD